MTTRSSSKKTLQSFHARNTLWEMFEEQAKKMECSVDYLVNEAMRLYASSNGLLKEDSQTSAPPSPVASPVAPPMAPANVAPVPTISERPGGKLPRPGGAPRPPIPRPAGAAGGPGVPPPRSGSSSQAVPRPTGQFAPPQVPSRPTLTLIFQGRKVPITQDQFIIGRGTKSSDLTIKDGNISRKHAAVIYHNGAYYIKDLGSTNGVEYNGKTVDSKRIDEGDVFGICGHDVHFTYSV